jgi:spore coat polysaccharide biosynthesis protein SpsF
VAEIDVQCILQARVSSTRLPGKVLLPILGEPMLARQVERVRRASRVDLLTVATSDDPSDDGVADLCAKLGVACHRGSLDDVLDRFYQAAVRHRPRHVLRLTGDCPLTDPTVIDRLVELHVAGAYDYSSDVRPRTFPHGLDAEIFTFGLLERTWREAETPYEREHVTPRMYARATSARLGSLTTAPDRSGWRLTVDYPEDFAVVSRVFEALYPNEPAFTTDSVIQFLEAHPEVAALNARHRVVPTA